MVPVFYCNFKNKDFLPYTLDLTFFDLRGAKTLGAGHKQNVPK